MVIIQNLFLTWLLLLLLLFVCVFVIISIIPRMVIIQNLFLAWLLLLLLLFVCVFVQWQLEEAKLLRAQGQHEMAINLAKYISENYQLNEEASDVYRLVGKWLAETRSSK